MKIERNKMGFSLALMIPITAMFVIAICNSQAQGVMIDEDQLYTISDPLLYFTNNLFRSIPRDNVNVILSPLSAQIALNLVLLGASKGSETEQELVKALGYSNCKSCDLEKIHKSYMSLLSTFQDITRAAREEQASFANKSQLARYAEGYGPPVSEKAIINLWTMLISKRVEPKAGYVKSAMDNYFSSVKHISDSQPEGKAKLINEINKWGKEAGFDGDLFKKTDLDGAFAVMLISAVQLQAFWFKQFSIAKDYTFYNMGNEEKRSASGLYRSSVNGKFLELTQKSNSKYQEHYTMIESKIPRLLGQLTDLDCRVVEVGLKDGFEFTIFEPLCNEPNALSKLESKLFPSESGQKLTRLSQVYDLIESGTVNFDYLAMPAFKFDNSINLVKPLKDIGINRIFDSGKAELGKLSSVKTVVDKVKQQAFIDVNKNGIKAAAITSIEIFPTSIIIKPEPIRISIQHPFVFVVRYKKIPLFIGHVNKV